jgi:hypothetical protein
MKEAVSATDLFSHAFFYESLLDSSAFVFNNETTTNNETGEGKCQELLTGNGDMAKRRNELKEQRKKLVEFRHALDRLRNPSEDEEDAPSSTNDARGVDVEEVALPTSRPGSAGSDEGMVGPDDLMEDQPEAQLGEI